MSVPQQNWVWRARPDRVVDGDTIWCVVDRGYNDFSKISMRLSECWAPERFTVAGKAATAFVTTWLTENVEPDGYGLIVQTLKNDNTPMDARDKYARWTAKVWSKHTGRCLNTDLVEAGHATSSALSMDRSTRPNQ